MPDIFRCPFEKEGAERGSFIEVELNYSIRDRILAMCAAVAQLYDDRSKTAVRILLPERVSEGCDENIDLVHKLVRYQCEFLAADMDTRLYPFMPYHPLRTQLSYRLRGKHRYERLATECLMNLFTRKGMLPKSVIDLAKCLEDVLRPRIRSFGTNPDLQLGELRVGDRRFWLLRIDLSAFATYVPQDKLDDPAYNKALFTIVKTPFYPKAFGRYSDRVEIVATRDSDVRGLPEATKRSIRRAANEVHRRYGVRLAHVLEQQPTGLWIPDMKTYAH